MDAVSSVVLIVVTIAVGLAALVAVVQLWRHQPVHDAESDDEQTLRLERDGADVPTIHLRRK